MSEVTFIGLDLAKQVFQAHGVDANGATVFNRKLRRQEVVDFFGALPPCIVAMETCGSAYHWARQLGELGHDIRVLPARNVKPFVTRGKTDAGDAVAITQALRHSDVRAVPVKTAEQQASAMLLRVRTLLVRQKTNLVNALRGHMAEFGLVAERGIPNLGKLAAALSDARDDRIPPTARFVFDTLFAEIEHLTGQLTKIEAKIVAAAKADEDIQRLMTVPGIGVITATTIRAYVPDPGVFKSGRAFAAWLGLTPLANASGDKFRNERISKMGNPELRALFYIASLSVLNSARRYGRGSPWLLRLLERRPYKVVAIALANRTARVVWALLMKGGVYSPQPTQEAKMGS